MSFFQSKVSTISEKVISFLKGREVEDADFLALFACKDQASLEAYTAMSPFQRMEKQKLTTEEFFRAFDQLDEFIKASKGRASKETIEALEILRVSAILYAKKTIPQSERLRHPFRILALNRIVKDFDKKHAIQRGAGTIYRTAQSERNAHYQAVLKEELEARAQSEAFRAEENATYLATLPEDVRKREEALQRAERTENEALNKLFLTTKELMSKRDALVDLKKQMGFLETAEEKQLEAYEAQIRTTQAQMQQKVAQLIIRAQLLCKTGQMTPERYNARIAQLQSGDLSYALYDSEAARRAAGQLSGQELNEATLSRLEGKAREAYQTEINALAKNQYERTGSLFALPKDQLAELTAGVARLSPDTAEIALAHVEQNGVDLGNVGMLRFFPTSIEMHAKYRAKANEAYLATLSPEERKKEETLQRKEKRENTELEAMCQSTLKLRQDALHASGWRYSFYRKQEIAMQEKLGKRVAQLMVQAKLELDLGKITPERYAARIAQLGYGDFSYSLYNTKEARLAAGQYSMDETLDRIAPRNTPDRDRLTGTIGLDQRLVLCYDVKGILSTLKEIDRLSPDLKALALTQVERNGVNLDAKGIARALKLSKAQLQAYADRYNKLLDEKYPGLYSKTVMTMTPNDIAAALEHGEVPLALCSEEQIEQAQTEGLAKLQSRIKDAVESALKYPTSDAPLFLTDAQAADFFAVGLDEMMERFFKNPGAPASEIDLATLLATEDPYEFRQALFAKTPVLTYINIQYQEKGITKTEKDAFKQKHEATIKSVIAKLDLGKYVTAHKPARVQSNMYDAFLRNYRLSDQTSRFEALMEAHAKAEQAREEARAAQERGETLTEAQSKALTEPTPLEAYVEKQAELYFAQNASEQRQMIQKKMKEYAYSTFSRKPMAKDKLVKSLLSMKKDVMGNISYLPDDLPLFMESEETIRSYVEQYDLYIAENREAIRNEMVYEEKRKALDAAENEARGLDGVNQAEVARLRAVYEQKKAEFTEYQATYQADPKNKINTTSQVYRDLMAMEAVPSLQQKKKQVDLSARLHKPTRQTSAKTVTPQTPVAEKQGPTQEERE